MESRNCTLSYTLERQGQCHYLYLQSLAAEALRISKNLVLPKKIHPDSGSVIIDYEAKGNEPRYKMLVREPNPIGPPWTDNFEALLYTSHDGIHWDGQGKSGPMDDRSTFYYAPFRRKWVQSVRLWYQVARRARDFHDGDSFLDD